MKILILSDIHGNKTALESALAYAEKFNPVQILLLGDVIDYGPHSNEVIYILKNCGLPTVCNIWGNHEQAVVQAEYKHFSSVRGQNSAKFTHDTLDKDSWKFIQNNMLNRGRTEFILEGKSCLAVHGSLKNEYWGTIKPGDNLAEYEKYDYVFSGHSHLPHYFAEYFKKDNPKTRNKKKTVFINPGSVGQPRNLCPFSQFSLWDTETGEIIMAHVPYAIEKEQSAFTDNVDKFYKERLKAGV